MNENRSYNLLKWSSIALLITIGITIGLLYFNGLALALFKDIMTLLLLVAVVLLVLLQNAVRITIQRGKLKFKSAELKYGQVYSSGMIGIVVGSWDGAVVDANDTFLKILGYTRDELIKGLIRWDLATPPEFLEISLDAVKQLQTTGKCKPFEKQYIRKDGTRVWVLMGSAAGSESGKETATSFVIDVSHRHEAETKASKLFNIVKQQQEEFRSVFMNAPALISIRRGPELRYDFVNKAIMDLSGRTDHIGKTSEEMFPGSLRSEDARISNSVFETGIPKKGSRHKLVYKKDGVDNEMYLDFHLTPVYDHEGKVDGVATFGFEVTDLVKANQEMEISKNRFSFIADSLPHKILIMKTEGETEYLNTKWRSYLNIDKDGEKTLSWEDITHPDEMEEMREKWKVASRTGGDLNMDVRLKRGDGIYRWHSTKAIALKDSSGEIVSWVGVSHDIHDEQEQFKKLAESEVYFRTMADDSPFMIWKSDVEGKCVYVNNTWVKITGLSFEESMGFGFRKAMHDFPEGEDEKWLWAVDKKIPYEIKFQIRRADGALRWVLAQSSPYYAKGAFQGYIGSLADITDQELAARSLKELSDKKDEFISIASHELKTPLTSIKGFTQILLKNLDPGSKAYVFGSKINEHTTRLESLIRDLLDVSKINAGKLSINKDNYSLRSLIRESVENVQYIAQDHEIIADEIPDINYYGDKYRVEQVINNFLSNAIKYCPDSCKINVDTELTGGFIKINVRDGGIGISPENIDMLFDRFFRVDDASMRYQGLGLGLYISSQIVKQHNGEIGVESEMGKGSNFWFTIPMDNNRSLSENLS
ncbi:MAG: PAS domain-containing sensor histidine kinase [Daejeonella sp.]